MKVLLGTSGVTTITAMSLALILLATLVTTASAETTKQKRERLKAQTNQLKKPYEPGKSCFGVKFGDITSTHVTVDGVDDSSTKGEGTWSGSIFFDACVAPKWYLGASMDVIGGKVFSTFSNTLYDGSVHLKFNPMAQSKLNIRPAVALGYAMLGEKNGVPRTTFFSKKLYLETVYRLTARFGIIADFGMWWVNGSNDFADVTGDCIYGRLGLIFL